LRLWSKRRRCRCDGRTPHARCENSLVLWSCKGLSAMRSSAVWVLGISQCVFWGILYYAFSVLLLPMRVDLGVSNAVVAGAFSLGLAVNALLAIAVGRWLDRGHGPMLLRTGTVCAAALLLVWSSIESVAALYAVWVGLGACMALVLYETAFALVTRAIDVPDLRLRALASVTVMGGLASTIFLPIVGTGVSQLGWRMTLRILVVAWLIAAWMLERFVLPAWRRIEVNAVDPGVAGSYAAPDRFQVFLLGAPFVAATFAAMALTTLVIPTLVDFGHPIASAAWVLATLGIMQLPGRIWLWRGGGRLSARGLLMAPLILQAAGLALLGAAKGLVAASTGVALFGIGAGLHTLARPWIVPQLFGVAAAGRISGSIARAQGIARAAGPFAAAGLYGQVGSMPVFFGLAILLGLLCACTYRLALWSTSKDSANALAVGAASCGGVLPEMHRCKIGS
jgi:MFS family permease